MSRFKIICHGILRTLCDPEVVINAASPAEAIKLFSIQQPKLQQMGHRFIAKVVGYDRESLFKESAEDGELHLIPALHGGKSKGGFIQIAIGALMIAASFIPGLNVAVWAGAATTWSSLLFSIGMSLALGGLLALMSPAPKRQSDGGADDPEASKYLGGGKNTVKIGTRIGILYGRFKVPGHYLSFDIQAVDVAAS